MVPTEVEPTSQPQPEPEPEPAQARISFSREFLDENNFISICPNDGTAIKNPDFEFLSSGTTLTDDMITADELFSEGKLLPFCQIQKLDKITLNSHHNPEESASSDQINDHDKKKNMDQTRISWFLDDDPSPRPPKCTVLWKELLRLKKQRASSTLSPSSSSSSGRSSTADQIPPSEQNNNKIVKRVKKGLERTRSASIRIRPVIHVPAVVCAQGKAGAGLPPLFSMRRSGKLET